MAQWVAPFPPPQPQAGAGGLVLGVASGGARGLKLGARPEGVSSFASHRRPSSAAATAVDEGKILWALWDTVNKGGRTLYGKPCTDLRSFFDALDADGQGIIVRDRLRDALVRLGIGLTKAQANVLVNRIDADIEGTVDFDELSSWVRRREDPATAKQRLETAGRSWGAGSARPPDEDLPSARKRTGGRGRSSRGRSSRGRGGGTGGRGAGRRGSGATKPPGTFGTVPQPKWEPPEDGFPPDERHEFMRIPIKNPLPVHNPKEYVEPKSSQLEAAIIMHERGFMKRHAKHSEQIAARKQKQKDKATEYQRQVKERAATKLLLNEQSRKEDLALKFGLKMREIESSEWEEVEEELESEVERRERRRRREQEMRDDPEGVRQRRQRRKARRVGAALRIQAWYRGAYVRRVVMRELRREAAKRRQREAIQTRKRENACMDCIDSVITLVERQELDEKIELLQHLEQLKNQQQQLENQFNVFLDPSTTEEQRRQARRLADQDEVRMCRRWPKYVVWEAVAQAREAELQAAAEEEARAQEEAKTALPQLFESDWSSLGQGLQAAAGRLGFREECWPELEENACGAMPWDYVEGTLRLATVAGLLELTAANWDKVVLCKPIPKKIYRIGPGGTAYTRRKEAEVKEQRESSERESMAVRLHKLAIFLSTFQGGVLKRQVSAEYTAAELERCYDRLCAGLLPAVRAGMPESLAKTLRQGLMEVGWAGGVAAPEPEPEPEEDEAKAREAQLQQELADMKAFIASSLGEPEPEPEPEPEKPKKKRKKVIDAEDAAFMQDLREQEQLLREKLAIAKESGLSDEQLAGVQSQIEEVEDTLKEMEDEVESETDADTESEVEAEPEPEPEPEPPAPEPPQDSESHLIQMRAEDLLNELAQISGESVIPTQSFGLRPGAAGGKALAGFLHDAISAVHNLRAGYHSVKTVAGSVLTTRGRGEPGALVAELIQLAIGKMGGDNHAGGGDGDTFTRVQYRLVDAFKFFDRDGDGKISPKEMQLALRSLTSDGSTSIALKDIKKFMKRADSNGDGSLDYAEFVAHFHFHNAEKIRKEKEKNEKEQQQRKQWEKQAASKYLSAHKARVSAAKAKAAAEIARQEAERLERYEADRRLPPVFHGSYQDMGLAHEAAAFRLGFRPDCWPRLPTDSVAHKPWEELSTEMKRMAAILGFDEAQRPPTWELIQLDDGTGQSIWAETTVKAHIKAALLQEERVKRIREQAAAKRRKQEEAEKKAADKEAARRAAADEAARQQALRQLEELAAKAEAEAEEEEKKRAVAAEEAIVMHVLTDQDHAKLDHVWRWAATGGPNTALGKEQLTRFFLAADSVRLTDSLYLTICAMIEAEPTIGFTRADFDATYCGQEEPAVRMIAQDYGACCKAHAAAVQLQAVWRGKKDRRVAKVKSTKREFARQKAKIAARRVVGASALLPRHRSDVLAAEAAAPDKSKIYYGVLHMCIDEEERYSSEVQGGAVSLVADDATNRWTNEPVPKNEISTRRLERDAGPNGKRLEGDAFFAQARLFESAASVLPVKDQGVDLREGMLVEALPHGCLFGSGIGQSVARISFDVKDLLGDHDGDAVFVVTRKETEAAPWSMLTEGEKLTLSRDGVATVELQSFCWIQVQCACGLRGVNRLIKQLGDLHRATHEDKVQTTWPAQEAEQQGFIGIPEDTMGYLVHGVAAVTVSAYGGVGRPSLVGNTELSERIAQGFGAEGLPQGPPPAAQTPPPPGTPKVKEEEVTKGEPAQEDGAADKGGGCCVVM